MKNSPYLDKPARSEAEVLGHTPGPWRLHDMERATIVAGKPGGEVANCLNGFGNQDANARLITAAPDLLAALKSAVKAGIALRQPYEAAIAAIAVGGVGSIDVGSKAVSVGPWLKGARVLSRAHVTSVAVTTTTSTATISARLSA